MYWIAGTLAVIYLVAIATFLACLYYTTGGREMNCRAMTPKEYATIRLWQAVNHLRDAAKALSALGTLEAAEHAREMDGAADIAESWIEHLKQEDVR